jgi:hypothetical protein
MFLLITGRDIVPKYKKVWVVTLEKNVYINVEVSKDDAQTEDEAIDRAFEDLSYDDKKNYEFEFVNITEEETRL